VFYDVSDAAVIVGDLVDGPVETLGDVVSVLKDVKVKGGKYFVTGEKQIELDCAFSIKQKSVKYFIFILVRKTQLPEVKTTSVYLMF
jgi:hypothetical protein